MRAASARSATQHRNKKAPPVNKCVAAHLSSRSQLIFHTEELISRVTRDRRRRRRARRVGRHCRFHARAPTHTHTHTLFSHTRSLAVYSPLYYLSVFLSCKMSWNKSRELTTRLEIGRDERAERKEAQASGFRKRDRSNETSRQPGRALFLLVSFSGQFAGASELAFSPMHQ